MTKKNFKISKDKIKEIIIPIGSCIASDKITVEGLPVGYMYREKPNFNTDSGWRFFSATESQEYMDNAENLMIYDVNTIANYDAVIVPYLQLAIGIELERKPNNVFHEINT